MGVFVGAYTFYVKYKPISNLVGFVNIIASLVKRNKEI